MTQTTSQVEAAAAKIFQHLRGHATATYGWQDNIPGDEERARKAHEQRCIDLIANELVELASQQEVAEGDYKNMWLAAVSTLAKIDALLGLPEDGCNDPDYTLSALQDYMAGVAEVTRTDVPYTLDDVRAWIKQGQDRAASQQEVAAPVGMHVGDSDFETWYAGHAPNYVSLKQWARDAYAAGMSDPLAAARVSVASPASRDEIIFDNPSYPGWLEGQSVGAGGPGVMDARPDSVHSDSGECDRVQVLRRALERIAAWELPQAFDREGKPSSYTLEYGSNGARDHFRAIAMEALMK